MGDQMPSAPAARRPLSKRVRFEVFKRDDFRCTYCGRHPPDVLLEADHITPVCDGGDDSQDNLTTACFDCNRGKGGVPLSAVPQSLADKAADIAEREEQLAGYRAVMQAKADRIELDAWGVAFALFPALTKLRRDWFLSIKNFTRLLAHHELIEAAEKAYARRPDDEVARFKYFCGICWSKIRETGGNG